MSSVSGVIVLRSHRFLPDYLSIQLASALGVEGMLLGDGRVGWIRVVLRATPLLEEERDPLFPAPIADLPHPCGIDRPRLRTRLSASDHPLDALEIQVRHRAQERFERDKSAMRPGPSERLDPVKVACALHAHPHPDV